MIRNSVTVPVMLLPGGGRSVPINVKKKVAGVPVSGFVPEKEKTSSVEEPDTNTASPSMNSSSLSSLKSIPNTPAVNVVICL